MNIRLLKKIRKRYSIIELNESRFVWDWAIINLKNKSIGFDRDFQHSFEFMLGNYSKRLYKIYNIRIAKRKRKSDKRNTKKYIDEILLNNKFHTSY